MDFVYCLRITQLARDLLVLAKPGFLASVVLVIRSFCSEVYNLPDIGVLDRVGITGLLCK